MASILFFFLFFLFKNNFASAKIALSFFRDTRLFGGVAATNTTLGHSDHLLSVGIKTDGSFWLHPHLIAQLTSDLLTQHLGLFPGFGLIFHIGELFRGYLGVISEYPR